MADLEHLKDVYATLLLVTNSIVLALSLLAFGFVLVFWRKPVIVLSQRGFLLGVPLALAIVSGSYFAGSATTSDCWVHYTLWYFGFNVFFAMLTAREWRVWRMYKNIKDGVRNQVSHKWPSLYIAVWGVLIILVVIFTWLLPYTTYGTKPCQRSSHDKKVTSSMAAVAQLDAYFGLLNHVLALIMAFIARSVPSICGDAQSIFAVTILGMIYISITLASYNTESDVTRTNLRIAYTVVDFVLQVFALSMLVFKRAFYIGMSYQDLVKLFMNIELDIFRSVAGIRPASMYESSNSATFEMSKVPKVSCQSDSLAASTSTSTMEPNFVATV